MKRYLVFLFFVLFPYASLDAAWIGDKAEDFTLPGIDGSEISLQQYKGSVVFLNFWASWCGPCKKEFPQVNILAEEYSDRNLTVLAVNLDKKKKNVDKFLARYKNHEEHRSARSADSLKTSETGLPGKSAVQKSNIIIALDRKSKAVSKYGVRAMPTSFVIDQDGLIKYVHLGFNENDPQKWRSEIDSILGSDNNNEDKKSE